jgi:hypothetical protein
MYPSDTLEIFWGCFTPQLSPTHIPTHQQSCIFLALAEMGYGPVKSSTPGMHSLLLINKSSTPGRHSLYEINKRKTPGKGTREEKQTDQSPNKRPHPKVQNAHSFLLINFCCNNVEEVERPKSLDQLPAATKVKSSGQCLMMPGPLEAQLNQHLHRYLPVLVGFCLFFKHNFQSQF